MPLFGPPNIEKMEAKRNLDGLIEALKYEKDPAIPIAAAEALGRIAKVDDSLAVRRLANQVQGKDPQLRRAALLALGQIGSPDVLSEIVFAFEREREPAVWEAALWALAVNHDEKSQKALDDFFAADKPERHQLAVRALDKLGWQPGNDRLGAWYWLVKGDLDRLQELGYLAVGPLGRRLRSHNAKASAEAADVMVLLGSPAYQPLVNALDDQNVLVRQQAARALGEFGDPGAGTPLLKALQDPALAVREAALKALMQLDTPQIKKQIVDQMLEDGSLMQMGKAYLVQLRGALIESALKRLTSSSAHNQAAGREVLMQLGSGGVEALCEALHQFSGQEVLQEVVDILEKIGDRSALPCLMQALDRETRHKNIEALIHALGVLGDEHIAEGLIPYLSSPHLGVQNETLRALGRIGDPRSAQPIIELLEELAGEGSRQVLAAEILGDLGSQDAIPILRTYLRAKRADLQKQAALSLEKLGWQPEADESGVLYWLVKGQWETPVQMGAKALPHLVDVLAASDPTIRKNALKALGAIGEASILPQVTAYLEDPDHSVRAAAREARRLLQPKEWTGIKPQQAAKPEAIQEKAPSTKVNLDARVLMPQLRNKSTRKQVLDQLKTLGTSALLGLVNAYGAQGEYTLQRTCITLLGEVGDSQAIPELGRCLLQDSEYRTRLTACQALQQIGDPAAGIFLAECLEKETSLTVKTAACRAAGELGASEAIQPLGEWLAQKPDYTDRIMICENLGQIGDREAGPILVSSMQADGSQKVRNAACLSVGDLGMVEMVPSILEHISEKHVDTAVEAIRRIGVAAIPHLGEALFHDRHFVRHAAIRALDELGWQPEMNEVGAKYWILKEDYGACSMIGDAAVDLLTSELVGASPNKQQRIFEALGSIASQRAFIPLTNYFLDGSQSAADVLDNLDATGKAIVVELLAQQMEKLVKYFLEGSQPAAKVMTWLGDPAVAAVADLLKGESPESWFKAAPWLAAQGWKPADDNTRMRYWIGLEEYENCIPLGKAALEPLIKTLPHSGNKNKIFYCLGEIGDSRAVDALIPYFRNGSETAANALAKLGEPAVAAVADIFKDEKPEYWFKAAPWLKEQGWEPASGTIRGGYWIGLRQYARCETLGEAAVKDLVTAWPQDKVQIGVALAKFDDQTAIEEILSELIIDLRSNSWSIRKEAARVLVALHQSGELSKDAAILILQHRGRIRTDHSDYRKHADKDCPFFGYHEDSNGPHTDFGIGVDFPL